MHHFVGFRRYNNNMGGFTNKLLRWDVRNIVDCWICCNFKVSSTVYTVLQMQVNYHFAHERFFVGCYLAFESKLSTITNTDVNIAPHIFFFSIIDFHTRMPGPMHSCTYVRYFSLQNIFGSEKKWKFQILNIWQIKLLSFTLKTIKIQTTLGYVLHVYRRYMYL